MSRKSERRQAREAVAGYHEAKLAELVTQVAEATDRFRDGELDAFDVDQVMFQYSRAARELWKFCNMGDVELTALQAHEGPPIEGQQHREYGLEFGHGHLAVQPHSHAEQEGDEQAEGVCLRPSRDRSVEDRSDEVADMRC